MEISFNDNEKDGSEYGKYWEQPIQQIQPTKKKVSFPDILSNMNLVVENGILKQMGPKKTTETNITEHPSYTPPQSQSQDNSYIINKYFRDYANQPPSPIPIPKTKEEYVKMLLEERQKRFEQQRRIKEIKSTQMNFTTNDMPVPRKPIQPSKNSLRKMSFG